MPWEDEEEWRKESGVGGDAQGEEQAGVVSGCLVRGTTMQTIQREKQDC
jgi:hypothetical protein